MLFLVVVIVLTKFHNSLLFTYSNICLLHRHKVMLTFQIEKKQNMVLLGGGIPMKSVKK